MCVNQGDLHRLEPGRWINSRIINYVIWSITNTYYETRLTRPFEICFLPTSVWTDYKTRGIYKAYTTVHPFLSTFVVIPMNIEDSHWIVVIVAYCKERLVVTGKDDKIDSQRPASIHVLDPLRNAKHNEAFEKEVIDFLDVVGSAQVGFQSHSLADVAFHWPDDVSSPTRAPPKSSCLISSIDSETRK